MRKVVYYMSNDGRPFDTAEEALAHEKEVEEEKKKIKKYWVKLYYSGVYEACFDAHDEDEALEKAREVEIRCPKLNDFEEENYDVELYEDYIKNEDDED